MAEVEDGPAPPSFEAEYALESPLKCPHCQGTIHSLQALRLARTRVTFVSLLPRRGNPWPARPATASAPPSSVAS